MDANEFEKRFTEACQTMVNDTIAAKQKYDTAIDALFTEIKNSPGEISDLQVGAITNAVMKNFAKALEVIDK